MPLGSLKRSNEYTFRQSGYSVWVSGLGCVGRGDRNLPASGGREDAFTANFLGEHGMLRFYQSLGERPPGTALETDIGEIT